MTIFNSRSLLAIAIMMLSLKCLAEPENSSDSSIKDLTKAAVSSAIAAGKNLLGGVNDGILAGRESVQGVDGAVIISSQLQIKDRLTVEVLRSEPVGDRFYITLGFKNNMSVPLRLINLNQPDALIAIDQDGYANSLSTGLENPVDLTIPPKAAVRQKFSFEGPIKAVITVRIWGQEYKLDLQGET